MAKVKRFNCDGIRFQKLSKLVVYTSEVPYYRVPMAPGQDFKDMCSEDDIRLNLWRVWIDPVENFERFHDFLIGQMLEGGERLGYLLFGDDWAYAFVEQPIPWGPSERPIIFQPGLEHIIAIQEYPIESGERMINQIFAKFFEYLQETGCQIPHNGSAITLDEAIELKMKSLIS